MHVSPPEGGRVKPPYWYVRMFRRNIIRVHGERYALISGVGKRGEGYHTLHVKRWER